MVTASIYPSSFEEIQGLALHRLLTAEDLASFPDDGDRYEIIGGKLIVSPSPTYRHQRVSMKLGTALDSYLSDRPTGVVIAAPMDVYLSRNDVVQPDLLVVLDERSEIIEERGIMGAPDLVIEILSPSSMVHDFLRKTQLYERYGVREYWIVNPESEIVSVQVLDGDRYVVTGEYGREDTVPSAVLDGFELPLSVLFPERSEEPTKEGSQPANDE